MQAAVIGAFVGAFAAFLLGEIAVRGRRRREMIEQAVFALAIELPEVVVGYSRWAPSGLDRSMHGAWWSKRNRVLSHLTAVRAAARRPLWNHREIRRAADDLTARFGAAQLEWEDGGRVLDGDDLLNITTSRLHAATFPGTLQLNDAIAWYREHGFQSAQPHKPSTPWWRRVFGGLPDTRNRQP